jgi:hypothetical protein
MISAMPGEAIPAGDGLPSFVAYLAEIRSIRGLSGSPVFANLALGRHPDGRYNEAGSFALIGLVRGHFETRRAFVFDRPMTEDERDLIAVNSGIAMVTPILTVAEVLNSEELVQERVRAERDGIQLLGEGIALDE